MSDSTTPPILLTGAAGFIGFHVTRQLLDQGLRVYGVDNLNDYYDVQLKRDRLAQLADRAGFEFETLDLADRGGVAGLFERLCPQRVVHLAAQAGVRYSLDNPYAYLDSNLSGTLTILEGARHHGVEHLLYASSSSVYGANTKVPFSESDPVDRPVSLYAATKRANELMVRTYSHLYGLPATGLRFFTVYGPWGRPDMAYFKFAQAIRAGEAISIYNYGDMQRDFTYVDDVVEAIVRLVDCAPPADADGVPHRVFNIGNHQPVSLEVFIATLEDCLGQKAERNLLPMQPGDVEATYADTDALRALTDFAPRTPLADGLKAFAQWFDAYYAGRTTLPSSSR